MDKPGGAPSQWYSLPQHLLQLVSTGTRAQSAANISATFNSCWSLDASWSWFVSWSSVVPEIRENQSAGPSGHGPSLSLLELAKAACFVWRGECFDVVTCGEVTVETTNMAIGFMQVLVGLNPGLLCSHAGWLRLALGAALPYHDR